MKRFVAILLILVLVFALSATAFAAGAVVSPEKNNTDTTVTPDKGTTSPQTGESFSILWVILAAIAAVTWITKPHDLHGAFAFMR